MAKSKIDLVEAGKRIGIFIGVGGATHAILNYATRNFLNSTNDFVQRFGHLGAGLTVAGAAHFLTPRKAQAIRCIANGVIAGSAPTTLIGVGKAFNAPKISKIFELSGGGSEFDPYQNGNYGELDGNEPIHMTFENADEVQAFIEASQPSREIPVYHGNVLPDPGYGQEVNDLEPQDQLMGDDDEDDFAGNSLYGEFV